jgi:ubiquinone biosynthesis protein COQ9
MLNATMPFVAQSGWTMNSLMQGAKSLGYPSVAHGMFPGGESGLIDAHLAYSRELFAKLVTEKKSELEMYALFYFYLFK